MNQYYIIGNPVNHSLSPVIYQAAFEKLGIDAEYKYDILSLKKEELGSFIDRMKEGGIQGASITIPFKEVILSYVDQCSKQVQLIKATNTLVLKNGTIIAYNTDGIGCVRSFKKANVNLEHKTVLLIGSGGAAKAIAVALLSEDIKQLIIINRTLIHASLFANYLTNSFQTNITTDLMINAKRYVPHADILINATPIGMKGITEKKIPIHPSLLHDGLIVFDSVYIPKKTELIKEAEKRNLKTIEGFHMLLYQGMEQFKLFTGKKAPEHICEKALLRQLE